MDAQARYVGLICLKCLSCVHGIPKNEYERLMLSAPFYQSTVYCYLAQRPIEIGMRFIYQTLQPINKFGAILIGILLTNFPLINIIKPLFKQTK